MAENKNQVFLDKESKWQRVIVKSCEGRILFRLIRGTGPNSTVSMKMEDAISVAEAILGVAENMAYGEKTPDGGICVGEDAPAGLSEDEYAAN